MEGDGRRRRKIKENRQTPTRIQNCNLASRQFVTTRTIREEVHRAAKEKEDRIRLSSPAISNMKRARETRQVEQPAGRK